jgi:hypothetical protein
VKIVIVGLLLAAGSLAHAQDFNGEKITLKPGIVSIKFERALVVSETGSEGIPLSLNSKGNRGCDLYNDNDAKAAISIAAGEVIVAHAAFTGTEATWESDSGLTISCGGKGIDSATDASGDVDIRGFSKHTISQINRAMQGQLVITALGK